MPTLRHYADDNTLSAATANTIFDILVAECGAPEKFRSFFLRYLTEPSPSFGQEIRFEGALGFGGKFTLQHGKMWVSCYREDETPERLARIARAHEHLDGLIAKDLS